MRPVWSCLARNQANAIVAVSVVLDLMQPIRAGGWTVDEERLTRENETSGWVAP